MIFKTQTSAGWCYIIAARTSRKLVDVGVFVSTADMNVFEAEEWEQLDHAPIKGVKDTFGMKRSASALLPAPGENVNLCTIRDYKIIKGQLVGVVGWLKKIGYQVTTTPVDSRRVNAVTRMLSKAFRLSVVDVLDEGQVLLIEENNHE